MAELPVNCVALEQAIANATERRDRAQRLYNEQAQRLIQLNNNKPLTPEQSESLQPERDALERRRTELETAERELADAKTAFTNSGFSVCKLPNKCEGEDTLSKKALILTHPNQVTDTTKLNQEIQDLRTQVSGLKNDIENCIYSDISSKTLKLELPWRRITNKIALANEDGYISRIKAIEAVRQDKCGGIIAKDSDGNQQNYFVMCYAPGVSPAPKEDMIRILEAKNSFPASNDILITRARGEQLKSIAQKNFKSAQELLESIVNEEHPLQLQIIDKEAKVQNYTDPTSGHNDSKKTKQYELIKQSASACQSENHIKFSSSVTVTAQAGPGVPPNYLTASNSGVSITKQNPNCIKYDGKYTFTLDESAAVALLGPGGCKAPVTTTNAPYWLHPVNITASINITNLQEHMNCIITKFQNKVKEVADIAAQPLSATMDLTPSGNFLGVSHPPTPGYYWPSISGSPSITIVGCVGDK